MSLLKRIKQKYLKIIGVILIIIISNALLAQGLQEKKADSLCQISFDYLTVSNVDSADLIARNALSYSIVNNLTFYTGKSYYAIGCISIVKNRLDSAIIYLQKADSLVSSSSDVPLKGKINARIGFVYRAQNNNDLAIERFNSSIGYFEHSEDTIWLGTINNNLGFIYFQRGNYYKALECFHKSINYFEKLNSQLNIGSTYNAIGLVYRKTNNLAKERASYISAIKILEQFDNSSHLSNAYNNLSEVYFDKGEIELGMETLEKAKIICKNNNNASGLCAYYAVLSYFYSEQKTTDFNKVLIYGIKGLEIAKEINSYRQYADACYFVGLAYFETQQVEKARTILEDGCEIAEQHDYIFELVRLKRLLADVYNNLKLPQEAYDAFVQYAMYNDSISGEDKIKEFTSLDLSYKFKQKGIEDSIYQAQKVIQLKYYHEKEIQNQRISQLILFFAIIVVLIIAIFGFVISHRRKTQSNILNQKNAQINKSLHEKELLLKEIHHRVKNNFQIVSSLMDLQLGNISDKKAISNIEEGQSRIKAMALIHQKLYQNDNISQINFHEYASQLAYQIASTYNLNNLAIDVETSGIYIDIDTSIPLGLILNELITNSCKYAFDGIANDKLTIRLSRNSDMNFILEVNDTGAGMPEDIDYDKIKSLGLKLTKRLAKQLHGTLKYKYDGGSVFVIEFKDTFARKEVD